MVRTETSQASASSGAVTRPRACRVVRMERRRLARILRVKAYLTQDVRYAGLERGRPTGGDLPMSSDDRITLYYSPQTRAGGTRVLLEELGAPYDLHVLNMKAGEQRKPAYLAINPLGKVPAIGHRGQLVTEQVAITIYLADLFPQAGLTPAIDDVRRGPYLRWITYYGSSFEPALIDRAMKREPAPMTQSPYGTYDTMLGALRAQLATGPYLLGERMTAADVLWGTALNW